MLDSLGVDGGSLEGDEAGVDFVEIVVIIFLDFVVDLEIMVALDRLIDDEGSWEDDEAEVDVVIVALLDRLVEDETLAEDEMAEVSVVEIVGVKLRDVNVKFATIALLNRLVEDET